MKRIFAPIFFILAVALVLRPADAKGVVKKGLKVAAATPANQAELVVPVSTADMPYSKQVPEKTENGSAPTPAQKSALAKPQEPQEEHIKSTQVKTEKTAGADAQKNGKNVLPEA